MSNIKKNEKKEEERKRLARALKQNILRRKKQQQVRQNRPLSKFIYGEKFLERRFMECLNMFLEFLTVKLSPET
ncbi:hypothetical protein [Wolbachia endosymbiont of Dirofilaria (Dirofilaria) immitis]|uniref:hypothetical protein n=1 Tax=Wolbachia endosymbiont of Dirofilaria (Dirofilaria) immitis TaxID=1812115 RepID=UPI001FE4B18F|nr:hypothetical protein [Wolbachia endosymbiont of Dirofilaria (Dirofilaria) immitis]